MPLDLADYENKAREAVKAFWVTAPQQLRSKENLDVRIRGNALE